MNSRYSQVVRAVVETPWAILPSKLAIIVELVARRAEGERLSEEEIRERIGAGPATKQSYTTGAVAVLPLYGVIIPRATMFSDMSGGTSVQRFSEAFRAALADQQVGSILIDVNSPGGQVDLIPELASEIRGARGDKPIVAIANTDAASAAYWLAAQADELVVTPSGEVGSIGVFAAHNDVTAAQEKAGIKTTLVSAGKHKTELSPFQPLSDEAREALQAKIDEYYGMFVSDVAAGRGVTEDVVRDGFGQGRMVTAETALRLGMVDRVETFEQTVARLTAPPPGQRPPAATGFTGKAEAALDAVRSLVDDARSLAEVRRGRLTAAKRERLVAIRASLDEASAALDQLLAEVPDSQRDALLRERARYERVRALTTTT